MGKFAAAIVAVWLIAGTVIWLSRSARPTPQSLNTYVEKHSLEGLSPDKRADVIASIATQLNKLNFEERQEFRKLRSDRKLFEQMSAEERSRFLDLTLPEGFRQLMVALNKMDPARRKKIVQRALDDMEKENPEARRQLDNADVQKILSQGMNSFYEEASADVKLDFAPVIEQLQRTTQGMR